MTILDIDEIEKQYGKENAKDMLVLFLKNLHDEAKKLHIAHQNEDWSTIYISTHKLNGAACYCSAMQLIEICSELESAISIGNKTQFEELYQKLLQQISLVENVIHQKLI